MASLRSLQNTVFCCCNNTKNIVEGTRDDLVAPGCRPSMLPITPTPPKKEETMQAPGNRPKLANHSMRESNPHCSHAGSQFCVSFLHDSGSGGNRTPDVSNVTGLQPAAFAARHTLPKKLGWLFKESNLVLFPKHSAIKLQPLTIFIRSPAHCASTSTDSNSYVKENPCRGRVSSGSPSRNGETRTRGPLAPKASALPPELHSED